MWITKYVAYIYVYTLDCDEGHLIMCQIVYGTILIIEAHYINSRDAGSYIGNL